MPVGNENKIGPVGVYVSASSAEKDRAKKWMDALRAKGIHVSSTWIEVVEKEGGGVANPRDASVDDRKNWAQKDVREALCSQVFWLLMPNGPHSFGAAFEYAAFVIMSNEELQSHVVSGDHMKTIFSAFSQCFNNDEEAFEQIVAAFEDYSKSEAVAKK